MYSQMMVSKAILGFGMMNKVSPRQIIFFRDGVSEGEFEVVVKEELNAISLAIDLLWTEKNIKDPKPKLTFIIVGKRYVVWFRR